MKLKKEHIYVGTEFKCEDGFIHIITEVLSKRFYTLCDDDGDMHNCHYNFDELESTDLTLLHLPENEVFYIKIKNGYEYFFKSEKDSKNIFTHKGCYYVRDVNNGFTFSGIVMDNKDPYQELRLATKEEKLALELTLYHEKYIKLSEIDLYDENTLELKEYEPKSKFEIGDVIDTDDTGYQFTSMDENSKQSKYTWEEIKKCNVKTNFLKKSVIKNKVYSSFTKSWWYKVTGYINWISENCMIAVSKTKSEHQFEVGKWYEFENKNHDRNHYGKFKELSNTTLYFSPWIISKRSFENQGAFDKDVVKIIREITDLSEIQEFLPDSHVDKIKPVEGKNQFVKGDYIVLLETKGSLTKKDFVVKQRTNDEIICPEIDCVNFQKLNYYWDSYKFSVKNWRYATPEEIAKYDRLGKPYDVTTLNLKKDDKGRVLKTFEVGKWYTNPMHFSNLENGNKAIYFKIKSVEIVPFYGNDSKYFNSFVFNQIADENWNIEDCEITQANSDFDQEMKLVEPNFKSDGSDFDLEPKQLSIEELIEEAKNRYPINSVVTNENLGLNCRFIIDNTNFYKDRTSDDILVRTKSSGSYTIYKNGNWAEIVEKAKTEEWIPKVGDWVVVNTEHLGNNAKKGSLAIVTKEPFKGGIAFNNALMIGVEWKKIVPEGFIQNNGGYFLKDFRKALPNEIPVLNEEFILPEKWCIKACKELNEYGKDRNDIHGNTYNHYYWWDLKSRNSKGLEKWFFSKDLPLGYKEITFEQFKKYVLKENSTSNLEKPMEKSVTTSNQKIIVETKNQEELDFIRNHYKTPKIRYALNTRFIRYDMKSMIGTYDNDSNAKVISFDEWLDNEGLKSMYLHQKSAKPFLNKTPVVAEPNSDFYEWSILNKTKPFDLSNTKIRVNSPEESEKVQKIAFDLGWSWYRKDFTVQKTNANYLFFLRDKCITYSTNENFYYKQPYKEITLQDLGKHLNYQSYPLRPEEVFSKQNINLELLTKTNNNSINSSVSNTNVWIPNLKTKNKSIKF